MPNEESFPLQEENRPVGGFSLRGSLVSALEDNGVPTGKVQLHAGLQASGSSSNPPLLCCQQCSADGLSYGSGVCSLSETNGVSLKPISELRKRARGVVFLVF